jgi:hypothetical protein
MDIDIMVSYYTTSLDTILVYYLDGKDVETRMEPRSMSDEDFNKM